MLDSSPAPKYSFQPRSDDRFKNTPNVFAHLEDIAEIGIFSVRQIFKRMDILLIPRLLNASLSQLILLPVLAK